MEENANLIGQGGLQNMSIFMKLNNNTYVDVFKKLLIKAEHV